MPPVPADTVKAKVAGVIAFTVTTATLLVVVGTINTAPIAEIRTIRPPARVIYAPPTPSDTILVTPAGRGPIGGTVVMSTKADGLPGISNQTLGNKLTFTEIPPGSAATPDVVGTGTNAAASAKK